MLLDRSEAVKDEASYVCDSCGEEIVVPLDVSAVPTRSTSRIARSAADRTSFTSKSTRAATCGFGPRGSRAELYMIPLHRDPWFTFRFADDRRIPRFHLEGIEAGRRVSVVKIDHPNTGERRDVLATAVAGAGGWVDLTEPIIVRAGETFIAVPEPDMPPSQQPIPGAEPDIVVDKPGR